MNRIGLMGANPGMRRPMPQQQGNMPQGQPQLNPQALAALQARMRGNMQPQGGIPQLTPQQLAMLRQRMQQGGMPGQPQPQQPQMSQPFGPPRAW
jgi:hypothetical protein